ncbi:MAG: hypothetical protein K2M69_05950, partial [Muribaculaceae bacterium]|nr:hypothetical protein [Muribaculaceae bacterium]
MSLGNTDIQGSLNVSRTIRVGGGGRVEGDWECGHDLVVEGWLYAKNIRGANKGLFRSAERLREVYPRPQDGWWALVGTGLPAAVYIAEDGVWVATGENSGILVVEGEGDGLTAEDAAALQSALAETLLPTLTFAELDTLGTDGSTTGLRNFIRRNRQTRYRVSDSGVPEGIVEIFSDSMLHVVTEVLTTHNVLDSEGNFSGAHKCQELHSYYRSYNLGSPYLENSKGSWTAWQIYPEIDTDDLKARGLPCLLLSDLDTLSTNGTAASIMDLARKQRATRWKVIEG